MKKALTILILMLIITYPVFLLTRKYDLLSYDDASELLYTGIYFILSMFLLFFYFIFKLKVCVIGAGYSIVTSIIQYSDFLYEEKVTPKYYFIAMVGVSSFCLLTSLIIYLYDSFRNR